MLGLPGFNPFSFRSPSKRQLAISPGSFSRGFNPFSFRSPSKLTPASYLATTPRYSFNPFSFRSPSKQISHGVQAFVQFQSLLVQVSFKTGDAGRVGRWYGFNPFSFRSPSKHIEHSISLLARLFQSLLVQVSFKTKVESNFYRTNVSIPSRSGLLQNTPQCCRRQLRKVSIPSRSGLLQNPRRLARSSRGRRFQSLLVQVSFKTTSAQGRCGIPLFQSLLVQVSFKTQILRQHHITYRLFQSLLVQVSFKTEERRQIMTNTKVSIPSRSGLLQNAFRTGCSRCHVSIPSRSGLLQNVSMASGCAPQHVSIPSRSGLLQNKGLPKTV